MKQIFFGLLGTLFHLIVYGQVIQTPLSVANAAGGTGGYNSTSVEWTIGEVIIGGGTNSSPVTSIGEQQGRLYPVAINDVVFDYVKLYPNPAGEYFIIDNLPAGTNAITLLDVTGRLIMSRNAYDNSAQIDARELCPGPYFLSISNFNNKKIFKVIITH